MPRVDEGNAFADQGGNDVDDELVDQPGIQKRGDEFPAADQPDVFPRSAAEPPRKLRAKGKANRPDTLSRGEAG
jgi:hypothetical protein